MPRICSQCSTPVTEELPGGLCPSCLLKIARRPRTDATMASDWHIPGMKAAPPVEDLARKFPELEIIEQVGQGGMGAVYKAKQRNLDRLVALKIFLYRSNDPEFAERFKREARALGKLSHPNIVAVHNFGIREDMHFLVMEFVDGLNLRQVTLEERLDPVHAMQLVPELCDALQYAHSEGVIHRDIKPENILLDTRGRIKIADFGLAKIAGTGADAGLTHTQQVMGTWNYMAPEQKERPTEVDHRADIYSLGVVIYEMLTGELPLGRFQVPSAKSTIDSRLDEVVMRALEKEPERRYQHASEFKSGFANYSNVPPMVAAGAMAAAVAPAPPVKANANANRTPANEAAQGMRLHACIMAGREKKGRWQVGDPNIAFTMMGGSCLDLTEVEARNVNIVSFVLMGGIEIVVPHGAIVDVDGLVIMGATVDKVNHSNATVADPMRVRVRSFGLWGGCEVRTTKRKPPQTANPTAPVKKARGKRRILANAAVLLAQAISALVTLSIPIIFLMGAFDIINDFDEAKMIGIICAITAGMFWIQTGHLRNLLRLPAPEATEDDIAEMHDMTRPGILVRMLATVIVFACPILFVINAFESNEDELKFAAIMAAIVGVGLFMAAGYVDNAVKNGRV